MLAERWLRIQQIIYLVGGCALLVYALAQPNRDALDFLAAAFLIILSIAAGVAHALIYK